MTAHFELRRSDSGRFSFNLISADGEIILSSGLYESRAAAAEGIAMVIASAHDETHYERRMASNRHWYFVLKAETGDFLGKSAVYASAASLENGIRSVIGSAAEATLKDLTELEPASK